MSQSLLERLRKALAGQYEVERELAAGGMGSIFLARDPTLERQVAVKILRPELATARAAERFLREARILASLSHPNVVPVHSAGEADGLFYYVMDYVEGETLGARLERGALSRDEAAKLGTDLLAALEASHAHGIVHRDVKPANIFLVADRALLGDFGIAKPLDEPGGLTAAGDLVGTPSYMAPEQLEGEVTPRTDLYAAGMVLY
ncbi:MAG: serine/threonine protein kinase, partial [Gammaproteobacteria bacterium]|nr:serine/threonine protein kinase [Gammaproteobacteria bacterium]